jgi:Na+/melibiose symporter-like transporter
MPLVAAFGGESAGFGTVGALYALIMAGTVFATFLSVREKTARPAAT